MALVMEAERGMHRAVIREDGNGKENERLRSAYANRQLHRANELTKQPQRERVLAHVLANHDPDTRLRFFSTPGIYWPFEKMLADTWGEDIDFVAVEWNWPVIELGMAHMPGTERRIQSQIDLEIGAVRCVTTERAKWVWSHASSFLSLKNSEIGSGNRSSRWGRRFRKITAAWLDLNTNFSDELCASLAALPFSFDRTRKHVPVAITFVMGQEHNADQFAESDTSLGKRLPAVVASLARCGVWKFELSDSWQYESEAGAHMANVIGVFHRARTKRGSHRPNRADRGSHPACR